MSVNEFFASMQQSQEVPEKSYKIDQLSDEDVYALDLLEKVGSDNITDEELEQAINNAKQNETLFKKTVEGLRKEYIRLQQDEEAQLANEQAA
jgi:benzoyl-CoA reductase/2-hydroxyglutaryl-CoA dehydratase subunit BcrC/BadD/HgdB